MFRLQVVREERGAAVRLRAVVGDLQNHRRDLMMMTKCLGRRLMMKKIYSRSCFEGECGKFRKVARVQCRKMRTKHFLFKSRRTKRKLTSANKSQCRFIFIRQDSFAISTL